MCKADRRVVDTLFDAEDRPLQKLRAAMEVAARGGDVHCAMMECG